MSSKKRDDAIGIVSLLFAGEVAKLTSRALRFPSLHVHSVQPAEAFDWW